MTPLGLAIAGPVGDARTAPFPPDDGEMVFEAGGVPLRQEVLRHAPMQVEQHGICAVPAPDQHPLFHAVDVDKDLLRDAAGQQPSVFIPEGFRPSRAPVQQQADKRQDANKQNGGQHQHHVTHLS